MRIGLNLLYLLPGEVGGTQTYARGLTDSLGRVAQADEFVVFVNQEATDWPLPVAPNWQRVVCAVQASRRWKRYRFEQLALPRLARQLRVDILHSLGYVAPLRVHCPSVVTVHDLNYRAFGHQMSWIRRHALDFFVGSSVRRAERVIADSEFSAAEIRDAFEVDERRIAVIHAAGAMPERTGGEQDGLLLERLGIRAPYIIAFSSRSPNKNIPSLLQAFADARRDRGLAHQLVLVGHPPHDGNVMRPSIALEPNAVRLTGYLGEDELQAVLRNAQMLAFPSVYEGFGLPVLEAMGVGVPVVCSNRGSLPEIAGDAAMLFDPYSTRDMAEKIVNVAGDPVLRTELVRRGYENLKRFSWERTARETLQVYRDVAAARAA